MDVMKIDFTISFTIMSAWVAIERTLDLLVFPLNSDFKLVRKKILYN